MTSNPVPSNWPRIIQGQNKGDAIRELRARYRVTGQEASELYDSLRGATEERQDDEEQE